MRSFVRKVKDDPPLETTQINPKTAKSFSLTRGGGGGQSDPRDFPNSCTRKIEIWHYLISFGNSCSTKCPPSWPPFWPPSWMWNLQKTLLLHLVLQSQPKVSGHPQKKALPRFPSFNVATMMSTFLSIFFWTCETTLGRGYGGKGSHCPM